MDITPLDLRVKQYIREFYAAKLQAEKQKNPYAIGVTVREVEGEQFVDELWVHLNTKLSQDKAMDQIGSH